MSALTTARVLLVSSLIFASCIKAGDGAAVVIPTPPPGGSGGPIETSLGAFAAPGLVGAVANNDSIHVSWNTTEANGQDAAVAIFASRLRSELYVGSPELTTSTSGQHLFQGLAGDRDYFIGFALETAADVYEPIGPALTLHTSPPVYVRADADPMIADGLTPATAFVHPFEAVLRAFGNGGGNVWVAAGEYTQANLPVFAGVHIFGGFDETFALDARDPETQPSVFVGMLGLPVVDVQGGSRFATLDGITVDGDGNAPIGISITDTPISLRNVDLFDCSGRGIRIRNQSGNRLESHTIAVRSSSNGADGLNVLGPFEFCIDRCAFNSNLQEGVEFDDLVGLDGEDSTLIVRASRFFGNLTQGFDVDLGAPLFPGTLGSRFDLRILGCAFEHNGEEGLLIDIDYDLTPAWTARIEVGYCTARANRGDGIHLDLDGVSNTLIHHCLATANALNGILLTSETTPAIAVVSTCAMTGNGARAITATLGNVPALVGHCVMSGNALGGILSDTIESSAVACIAHEQPFPFVGVREVSNLVTANSQDVFENIAQSWHFATSLQGDQLSVLDPTSIAPGSVVQVAGDGVARIVLAVDSAGGLRLDSPPEIFQAPARIEVFPANGAVQSDFHLPPESPASGAGFSIPGLTSDAGIFGAPLPAMPGAGVSPIRPRLRLAVIAPSLGTPVPANETVVITFTGAAPLPSSANSMSVLAITQAGEELSIGISVSGKELRVTPPPGGWPNGNWRIELHSTLSSETQVFTTPVALPFRTQ